MGKFSFKDLFKPIVTLDLYEEVLNWMNTHSESDLKKLETEFKEEDMAKIKDKNADLDIEKIIKKPFGAKIQNFNLSKSHHMFLTSSNMLLDVDTICDVTKRSDNPKKSSNHIFFAIDLTEAIINQLIYDHIDDTNLYIERPNKEVIQDLYSKVYYKLFSDKWKFIALNPELSSIIIGNLESKFDAANYTTLKKYIDMLVTNGKQKIDVSVYIDNLDAHTTTMTYNIIKNTSEDILDITEQIIINKLDKKAAEDLKINRRLEEKINKKK